MSHVTEIKLKVKDLDALEEALIPLGMELRRGQRTHAWYGRFVGDTTPPPGRDPKDYGKCEHAIRMKGANGGEYEIGLVRALDGDGYDLMVDTWGHPRVVAASGGPKFNRLRQEYAATVATKRAKATLTKKGFVASREKIGTTIRLKLRKR